MQHGRKREAYRYSRPKTYGQHLDGNPCAACGRPEADHLTAYTAPIAGGCIVVYAHAAADVAGIASKKQLALTGPVREATVADSQPLKTLRPWS